MRNGNEDATDLAELGEVLLERVGQRSHVRLALLLCGGTRRIRAFLWCIPLLLLLLLRRLGTRRPVLLCQREHLSRRSPSVSLEKKEKKRVFFDLRKGVTERLLCNCFENERQTDSDGRDQQGHGGDPDGEDGHGEDARPCERVSAG